MYSDLFTAESLAELKTAFLTQFPMALWETFYVTVLSTALAIRWACLWGYCWWRGRRTASCPCRSRCCRH